MSVPVRYRSANKLEAYTKTREMRVYTLYLCENQNYFPKKSRWNIANKIINDCIDCLGKIVKANKINPRDKEDAKVRTDLQYDVLLTFDEIWTLMDIASDLYSIESEKIEKWSSIMLKAEETVHAWRKANVKGYANLYGD